MPLLRTRDVQAVLSAVGVLYNDAGGQPWERRLLRMLAKLVPGDVCGYNEINLAGGPGLVITEPDDQAVYDLVPVLLAHRHEHPLIRSRSPNLPLESISDHLSRQQFHCLGLYQELYRVLDVEDQIAITLPAPWPTVIGVTMSRRGWGFSQRDRAILELLRPHLLNAQAMVKTTQRLQQQAQQWKQTLDSLPHALIAVSSEGSRLWQTDSVAALLDAYFPPPHAGRSGLPPRIRIWLSEQWARFEDSLAVVQPLIVNSEMGRLIVRPLNGPGGQRLLLLEEQPTSSATIAQLQRLNLTYRQAQVLHGVMQGGTNSQIGAELEISARTVQKHVENLFNKLGVQTRTAAATKTRELLGGVL